MIIDIFLEVYIHKNKNELAEFIKQMPFISHWSITYLSKLSELVEKVKVIRNQYIIKEGDEIEYIYMIKDGEFEI